MSTAFYALPGGAVGLIETEGEGNNAVLPPGAVPISQVEYEEAYAEILAAQDAARTAAKNAENLAKKADYDALILLGMPPATAARLSGWTPEGGVLDGVLGDVL